jgi:phage baseplate assembly protein W
MSIKSLILNNYMASVIIKDLNRLPKNKDYTYVDLELDLKLNYTKTNPLNNFREQRDIVADYDINAIKNSIFNIFTTIPGQKILNPIFGINIFQFLFTGITERNAQLLGETILRGIARFEPRVSIDRIDITPDSEENQYDVKLILSVPSLNIKGLEVKSTLAESGYYFN